MDVLLLVLHNSDAHVWLLCATWEKAYKLKIYTSQVLSKRTVMTVGCIISGMQMAHWSWRSYSYIRYSVRVCAYQNFYYCYLKVLVQLLTVCCACACDFFFFFFNNLVCAKSMFLACFSLFYQCNLEKAVWHKLICYSGNVNLIKSCHYVIRYGAQSIIAPLEAFSWNWQWAAHGLDNVPFVWVVRPVLCSLVEKG